MLILASTAHHDIYSLTEFHSPLRRKSKAQATSEIDKDESIDRVKQLCRFLIDQGRDLKAKVVAQRCLEREADLSELSKIKKLDLSYCELKELPSSMWLLQGLISLDLIGNSLTALPEEMAQLTKLTHLHLQGNKFEEVPSVIRKISSLGCLYLYDNPIKKLPKSLQRVISSEPLYAIWV